MSGDIPVTSPDTLKPASRAELEHIALILARALLAAEEDAATKRDSAVTIYKRTPMEFVPSRTYQRGRMGALRQHLESYAAVDLALARTVIERYGSR